MQFTVSNNVLLKHLQSVQGAIQSNAVLPILENFLFQIENNTLTVSTTDLSTSMTTALQVEATADGSITIPAKILTDTLKSLPEQGITIDFDETTSAIILTALNAEYSFKGEEANDYPKIPTVEGGESILLSAKILSDAINTTLFAVSTEELRPAMTGVYFEIEADKINFVATDAHKLVLHTHTTTIDPSATGTFIFPRKALDLLGKALSGFSGMVTLQYNKSNVFISFDDTSLVCRLIDQKYPNYVAVIPTEVSHTMNINRTDFLRSLKRISIFSNKLTSQVRLKIENDVLTMVGEDIDYAQKAHETLTCEFEDGPFEIGFNAKFLIEMLENLSSSLIKFNFSTPTRPGLMYPSETETDTSTLMLVMPVMLNN